MVELEGASGVYNQQGLEKTWTTRKERVVTVGLHPQTLRSALMIDAAGLRM